MYHCMYFKDRDSNEGPVNRGPTGEGVLFGPQLWLELNGGRQKNIYGAVLALVIMLAQGRLEYEISIRIFLVYWD